MENDASRAGIGKRIRELREFRFIGQGKTGVSRTWLSRIETGSVAPTLALLETLCDTFGISMSRLFLAEAEFQKCFLLEDGFVAEVLPFLKQLTPWQKEHILKVLAAAPVQKSARTRKRT